MKQCRECHRLSGSETATCPFCGGHTIRADMFRQNGNTEAGTGSQPLSEAEESGRNYRILTKSIQVNGTEYRFIDILGQGGHGAVLKIRDPRGKEFALKVPLEFNEHFTNNQGNRRAVLEMSAKYISHEVKMLNEIKSEAAIHVLYAGPVTCRSDVTERRFPAILMELAYGTLKDLIDAGMAGRITVPIEEKKNIINQITRAIRTLHRAGYVHRDLSPHNIFIVERQGKICYVLADFGTSKPSMAIDQGDSTTRMAFHERYMDPALSLYDHIRYDVRIDIYQIGVIITEILMGEYWRGDGDESITSGIRTDFETEFLMKQATHEIPPALLKILRKATTRHIRRRYRTAEKFGKDLQRALEKSYRSGESLDRGRFERNIYINFERIVPAEGQTAGQEKRVVHYRGQKRIDMGSGDQLQIEFPGIILEKAKIETPSFLECVHEENTVIIRVNKVSIDKAVEPVFRKGLPARIQFESRTILSIQGTRGHHPLRAFGDPAGGQTFEKV